MCLKSVKRRCWELVLLLTNSYVKCPRSGNERQDKVPAARSCCITSDSSRNVIRGRVVSANSQKIADSTDCIWYFRHHGNRPTIPACNEFGARRIGKLQAGLRPSFKTFPDTTTITTLLRLKTNKATSRGNYSERAEQSASVNCTEGWTKLRAQRGQPAPPPQED